MDKREIRKEVRDAFSHFSDKKAEEERIISRIRALEAYNAANTVLVYHALYDEADLSPLFSDGKTFLFPYIEGDSMFFSPPPLVKGAFGIMEPVSRIETCYDHALLVVPARALSKKGERIGRGKGYYDRFLASHKTISVGIAFDEQQCEKFETEKTDMRPDMIITPTRILRS